MPSRYVLKNESILHIGYTKTGRLLICDIHVLKKKCLNYSQVMCFQARYMFSCRKTTSSTVFSGKTFKRMFWFSCRRTTSTIYYFRMCRLRARSMFVYFFAVERIHLVVFYNLVFRQDPCIYFLAGERLQLFML